MAQFFATAPRGTEDLCADELRALRAVTVAQRPGGVAFEGPFELGMRACLWLRTGMRVLLPIGDFPARGAQELYDGTRALDWSAYLTLRSTFAVEATLTRSELTHTRFTALKIKDAIADAMRDKLGARPDVNARDPDVRVVAYVSRDHATIYLDLAGRPLNQRGYRVEQTEAPLKETLAAAVLLASGWDRTSPLCDPMCGSGTIAIEAAWMSMDRAPGRGRAFGFERWPSFDDASRAALARLREEADARALPAPRGPIFASDWHEDALAAAQANVRAAGLAQVIAPARMDARDAPPLAPPGWIVTNPPYGERMGQSRRLQLSGLYRAIGERWSGFFGHRVAVLSGSEDLEPAFGMTPAWRRTLWNGPLRCELLVYEIGQALKRSR